MKRYAIACCLLAVLLFGAAGQSPGRDLRWVRSFTYVLQDIDIQQLGVSDFDLVVMDYSADGGPQGEFTPQEIATVKGQDKVVLAYLSIGEAEDYRFYWQAGWTPGNPSWLGPENPNWPGNYRVQYWDPAWQAIILGYLDRIIGQGFDGIYLDIVDGYEYWETHGNPGARSDMVDWINVLADHARQSHGLPEFYVIAQNGEELADHQEAYAAGYLAAIDGVGRESVFFEGDQLNPPSERLWVSGFLDQILCEGKLVMTVDYCTGQSRIDHVYASSSSLGWVPYVTVLDLNLMTINPGYEPPAGPPPTEAVRYVRPDRVINKQGTSAGHLSTLMSRNSEGTTYGDTMVFSKKYYGIMLYALPNDLDPTDVLEVELLVNYIGPGYTEQKWHFGLYRFSQSAWRLLGNNQAAIPWQFTALQFTASPPAAQYSDGQRWAAGLYSPGNSDVCELDFMALKIRYQR